MHFKKNTTPLRFRGGEVSGRQPETGEVPLGVGSPLHHATRMLRMVPLCPVEDPELVEWESIEVS
jgi:hypothetical protein